MSKELAQVILKKQLFKDCLQNGLIWLMYRGVVKANQTASALCLWIDRRVSLEDLRRTVTSVEIDDFKNLSETTTDFLANHFAARGAFDFFSPIENVKEEVQRRVYFEDSGIQLKDGEHKNVKIFAVILTDVLKRVHRMWKPFF